VRRHKVERKPLNVWTWEQVERFLDAFLHEEVKWKVFCEVL
jgi:hypothetical protein